MQVVLLERIEKLGKMGDVVKVKDGFARNFLLPRKKALRATSDNIARFEKQRGELEKQSDEQKGQAAQIAERLEGKLFVVIRQAGDSGQLYGSVSTRDIADAVNVTGFSIDRTDVQLDRPIKTLGLHKITIVLHPEVKAAVTVNAARSAEEAERQARGEVVTRLTEAEEAEIAAEALFESPEAAEHLKEGSAEDEAAEPA
jgi:large subunit ribosomal protein L9